MSNQQPPSGGPTSPRGPEGSTPKGATPKGGTPKGGARKDSGPASDASSSSPKKGQGSGKNGKVKMRDLVGWAKVRHAAKKTLKWGTIMGLVGSLVTAIAIFVVYKTIDIPDPNTDFEAQTSVVYYSDGKHVLGQFALQNRQSIPLSQVPMAMQNAVISAEDRSFETNNGLDLKGIIRAAWTNLRSDQVEQGASTITQQYVKILYLSQERTYTRKIKEAFLAVKLQNTLSKDEILEGYLNTIYYGRGAYGVQAAAQAFFDKDAKDLTVPESAVLASVINSPSALDPANGKAARRALLGRYQYVLDGMVSMGNLDADAAAKFSKKLPTFPKVKQINKYGGQKGYLMTVVRNQLEAEGFTDTEIEGGGLKIITTLDWNMQGEANQTVKQVRPDGHKELHVALSAVEPGTGALRAMIGGRNYLDSQLNWATAGVQPGSTFKIFAIAAGLEDGFTLQSTFDGNSPFTYPDGETVGNEGQSSGNPYGQSYGAAITLTYATQESVNTAFADLTSSMDDGPQKVVQAAVDAGIPRDSRDLEPNLGVALGSARIANVEMAEGYATFAANGKHADWYIIQKVSDANGLRYAHPDKVEQSFSAAIASNVTYALTQVVQAGTGAYAQNLGRPAAGKTGTATAGIGDNQHVSSSWFVGYTPQLATAVTYSRGDGDDSLEGYLVPFYGANYPTQTWTTFMSKALEGTPVVDFPEPAELHGVNPTYTPPTYTPPPPTSSAPTTTEPTTSAPTTSAPTTSAPTTTGPTTLPATSLLTGVEEPRSDRGKPPLGVLAPATPDRQRVSRRRPMPSPG